jgi:orotidine-5'-phosphate decarboxylase
MSEPAHAADRLIAAIERTGAPVCVGIDPVHDRLPDATGPSPVEDIRRFVEGVLDAVQPHVPCVKFQSACFERYRAEGVAALYELIGAARDRGLQVVLDFKRGDVSISAEHYAAAAFGDGPGPDRQADWVTISGYLGPDSIEPFLREGRGVFVLARTSNPGGDAIQEIALADGRTVAETMGCLLATIGDGCRGDRGYSAVGAVVGATRPETAVRLREAMPHQVFLLPGFGAQGAGIRDILPSFQSGGLGAIVTASRSVIYASNGGGAGWTAAVGDRSAARWACGRAPAAPDTRGSDNLRSA